MDTMTTLSEILNKLNKEGYTEDFNLMESGRETPGNLIRVYPGEFRVDRHYRFEGISNPDDEAVVYAISSLKFKVKGTLVNGYGISSDAATDELLKALEVKKT